MEVHFGVFGFLRPHKQKQTQTKCVHNLRAPRGVSHMFILKLTSQYIGTWWILVILIAGKLEYPQLEPHAKIKMAQVLGYLIYICGFGSSVPWTSSICKQYLNLQQCCIFLLFCVCVNISWPIPNVPSHENDKLCNKLVLIYAKQKAAAATCTTLGLPTWEPRSRSMWTSKVQIKVDKWKTAHKGTTLHHSCVCAATFENINLTSTCHIYNRSAIAFCSKLPSGT